MYNQALIGKNLSEAERLLGSEGITDINVVSNDTKYEYKHDSVLVVKAEIDGKAATLYTSQFLLKI